MLDVKTKNAFFAGTLYLGDHTIKGGVDFQRDKYYNLFCSTSSARTPSTTHRRFRERQLLPVPAVPSGRTATRSSDVAASFSLKQCGVFLQDTWQATATSRCSTACAWTFR